MEGRGVEWEGLPQAAAQAKEEEIAKLTASLLLLLCFPLRGSLSVGQSLEG